MRVFTSEYVQRCAASFKISCTLLGAVSKMVRRFNKVIGMFQIAEDVETCESFCLYTNTHDHVLWDVG